MKSLFLLLLSLTLCFPSCAQDKPKNAAQAEMPDLVLVFTKTDGFRHKSIEKGMETLRELGSANGFIALRSESAEDFNPGNLGNYKLVVFLNTTEDVLNGEQQRAFEGYIKNGGSFMGIHAAADTEFDWPWYGRLVGGYFVDHPEIQQAKIRLVDGDHPATAHLPELWTRTDEWYNYKELNPNVHVLLNLEESSYKGGSNGENHPIAWYHEFEGGRAFYTGLGHTEESYDEPAFRQHLLGGLQWCLRRE